MIGSSRAERKASAYLRAQLSLKQAYERIDYAEDVVKPQLLAIRKAEATQEIEAAGELEEPDAADADV